MRRSRVSTIGLAGIVVTIASGASFGNPVASTFDVDAEGWTVVDLVMWQNDYRTIHRGPDPASWNPDEFIYREEAWGDEFFFCAPEKFLGDKSAMYGGSVSWDISNDPSGTYEAGDIALLSPTLVLVNGDPPQAPAWQVWGQHSVELVETSGWRVGHLGGPIPTYDEFVGVLADLTALRIRGEFRSGLETCYVDNVMLVPEPGSLSLLLAGAIALGVRRRA